MYKKILIPTDGSDLSTETALAGIEFARQNRTDVMGIFVAPIFQHPVYVDMIPAGYPTPNEYQESLRKEAESCLGTIQKAAEAAGVKFSGNVKFKASASVMFGPQITCESVILLTIDPTWSAVISEIIN